MADIHTSGLHPDRRNANRGTVRGRALLEDSLRKYGAGRSILADKHGHVIAGNKTLEAAADLGLPVRIVTSDGTELVVVQRTDLNLDSDKAARELAYADNRIAQLDLDWDTETLVADQAAGIDLAAVGFDPDELAALLARVAPTTGLTDPDAVPAVPAEPTTKPGDLWVLGRHRLGCLDSSDPEQVARVLAGNAAHAIITDPPYAFALASTSTQDSKSGGWHDMMNNATWFADRFKQWAALVPRGPLWVCCNWRSLPIMMRAAFDARVGLQSVLVWHKDWIGPGGTKGLRPSYELVCLATTGGYAIPDRGIPDHLTVPWSSHKPHGHQAEKPTALFAHLARISSVATLFDPFAGSGTTVIVAEQLGLTCYATEIAPAYCDVIVARWEQFTGGKAVRDGD